MGDNPCGPKETDCMFTFCIVLLWCNAVVIKQGSVISDRIETKYKMFTE